jgi:hypothetical protein
MLPFGPGRPTGIDIGVIVTASAAPSQLSVSFVVSAGDLADTNRIGERDGVPMLLLAAAAPILVGIVLWDRNAIGAGALMAIGIAAFAVTRVPAFQRFWLTRHAGSLIGERRDLTFDQEGIHERFNSISRLTPWIAFNEMRITPDGVYLFSNGRLRQMLPVRAFGSTDDVDRLIALVSAHASNLRIS